MKGDGDVAVQIAGLIPVKVLGRKSSVVHFKC
jgi:hypothetical protein